ncbi:MAG: hypothetical protein HGB36_06550 [Chlorobiaceae bacterium]|jgi:hypothetical protein|nr:hypothetical protein [Chlorobiaceae bacterium]
MSQEKIIIGLESTSEEEKWFVEILRNSSSGEYSSMLDSNNIEFPFDIKNFGPFEEDSLILKLKNIYPDADIILKW